MNNYIDLYNKYEKVIKDNRIEIYRMIMSSSASFSLYYTKNSICASRKVFSESLIYSIMDIIGDPKIIIQEIKNVTETKWKTVSDKNYLVLLFVSRAFAELKDYDKVTEVIRHLAQRFFSALLLKFFKFGCEDNVKNYTIATISDRFLIRKYEGNINKVLGSIVDTLTTSNMKKLLKTNDNDFISVNISLRSRINSMLLNFAKPYYQNKNDEKALVANVEVTGEDGGTISNNITSSNVHSSLINKTVTLFNQQHSDDYIFNKISERMDLSKSIVNKNVWDYYVNNINEFKELLNKIIVFISNRSGVDSICSSEISGIISSTSFKSKDSAMVLDHISDVIDKSKITINRREKRKIVLSMILIAIYYLRQNKCK